MDLTFSPEVWGMMMIASGFFGWTIANLFSLRNAEAEERTALHKAASQADDSLFSLSIAPKMGPKLARSGTHSAAQASAAKPAQSPRRAPLPRAKLSAQPLPFDRRSDPVPKSDGSQHQSVSGYISGSNDMPESGYITADASSVYEAEFGAHYDPDHYAGQHADHGSENDEKLPLAEIRGHARHLLQTNNVWEAPETQKQIADLLRGADPASADLLNHYLGSIEQLQRANDTEAVELLDREAFAPASDETPLLGELGPVMREEYLNELACRIEQRADLGRSNGRYSGAGG